MFNPLKTNATLVKKTLIIFVQKMYKKICAKKFKKYWQQYLTLGAFVRT